ncbi:hypothetical protein SEA_BANTAM_60 [Gordonia phage Bantam]|uniref:Uncharacterized protein n=1 Tax=Gordonia phage Bantam TaxID=1887641 RepID=A0A1B3AYD0_9CAUD|nr:hypothetical protein BIZ77_gp118 [Gordonia phage Bantam]AOE43750.1 hypothetical protein SEA_BANTAM_60 [Gordonia phage Bantam]
MGIKTQLLLDEEAKTYSIAVDPSSTTDVAMDTMPGRSTAQSIVRQELSRHLALRTKVAEDAAAVAVTGLMECFHLTPKTIEEFEKGRQR